MSEDDVVRICDSYARLVALACKRVGEAASHIDGWTAPTSIGARDASLPVILTLNQGAGTFSLVWFEPDTFNGGSWDLSGTYPLSWLTAEQEEWTDMLDKMKRKRETTPS